MAQRIEATPIERARGPELASVQVSVPAHKDYITLVRSAVAQLGACFGFTLGEIGDLRLAVDEACNLLVASPATGQADSALECRAVVRGDLLTVTVAGTAETAAEPPDTEGFGWIILTALVTTLAWERDDGGVRIELEKRRERREPRERWERSVFPGG